MEESVSKASGRSNKIFSICGHLLWVFKWQSFNLCPFLVLLMSVVAKLKRIMTLDFSKHVIFDFLPPIMFLFFSSIRKHNEYLYYFSGDVIKVISSTNTAKHKFIKPAACSWGTLPTQCIPPKLYRCKLKVGWIVLWNNFPETNLSAAYATMTHVGVYVPTDSRCPHSSIILCKYNEQWTNNKLNLTQRSLVC